MTDNSKKNYLSGFFSNQIALKEAEKYSELSFLSKSKNGLIIFMIIVSALTVGIAMNANIKELQMEELIYDLIGYAILLPFVYFNHRWAIFLVGFFYALGKLMLIGMGVGTPISHVIFLVIVSSLTHRAFMVAHYLKRIRKGAALATGSSS